MALIRPRRVQTNTERVQGPKHESDLQPLPSSLQSADPLASAPNSLSYPLHAEPLTLALSMHQEPQLTNGSKPHGFASVNDP
jgi:hypothetical protein